MLTSCVLDYLQPTHLKQAINYKKKHKRGRDTSLDGKEMSGDVLAAGEEKNEWWGIIWGGNFRSFSSYCDTERMRNYVIHHSFQNRAV